VKRAALSTLGLRGHLAAVRMMALALVLGTPSVALYGCSSSSPSSGDASCTSAGLCPKEPAPSSESILECQMSLGDPTCGPAYQALLNCAMQTEKCNADGTEDGGASVAASAVCSSERQAWLACLRKELDGGSSD
jgi:hypothetical protein